jgi:hypothetical protein
MALQSLLLTTDFEAWGTSFAVCSAVWASEWRSASGPRRPVNACGAGGEGGIGRQTAIALSRGEILHMRLELPGCGEEVAAQAEVGADPKGKTGVRFLLLEDKCRSALESWIAQGLGRTRVRIRVPQGKGDAQATRPCCRRAGVLVVFGVSTSRHGPALPRHLIESPHDSRF